MKSFVKSTDPRKKLIAKALKVKSGGNRISQVYQLDNGDFEGNCMKGVRAGYQSLGTFTVTKEEAGIVDVAGGAHISVSDNEHVTALLPDNAVKALATIDGQQDYQGVTSKYDV